jgi:hypothetical protein
LLLLFEAALKSHRGEKVVRLLLYRRGEDFPVMKEIVTAIARNYDEDIMTLLLEHRREEVSITSAMLEAAACNYNHRAGNVGGSTFLVTRNTGHGETHDHGRRQRLRAKIHVDNYG